jgi:hypothetical protein
MYLEEKLEIIFIMLLSYLAAISLMAGDFALFVLLLASSSLVKLREIELSEILWSSFLGALMAFLPIILLASNYQSLIPQLGTYKLVDAIAYSAIISVIVLTIAIHFPGLRRDVHVLGEALFLLVASSMIGLLAYLFGYKDILLVTGYTFVLLETLALSVDLFRWAKLKELFEKLLEK